ncbi:hypothetical protein SO802_015827 [Lithocarpus litseifolius]|uniref:Uncharacterized protein n=1 Tax=Lithocarpus litseifolius TaxID=425828 RepID=A0AAW2D038_9ROSI
MFTLQHQHQPGSLTLGKLGCNIIALDGLPPGAETTSDVPYHLHPHIMTAMDRSESHIELLLRDLKPDIVFFDFAYWLPKLARSLGAGQHSGNNFTKVDPMQPQSGFPVSLPIKLHNHEAREFAAFQAMKASNNEATEAPTPTLENWFKWLGKFKAGSVIYCAFGSECTLKRDQFQELVLGLELSGWPFLAALKPPLGPESIEEALPEGFEERVQGIGAVHGGWV